VIGYGLGWDSVGPNFFSEYGIQALFKGGDTVLYHSLLMVLPEHNMAFAVVMSSGSSIMYGLPMAQSVLSQALLAEGKIKEIFPLQDLRAPVASEVPIEAHGVCRPLRQQLRGKRDSNQPGWQSHGDTFVQRRHTQRDLLLYVGWRFCE